MRKSSSAGVALVGRHSLKAYARKQKITARSSAGAERLVESGLRPPEKRKYHRFARTLLSERFVDEVGNPSGGRRAAKDAQTPVCCSLHQVGAFTLPSRRSQRTGVDRFLKMNLQ